MRIARPHIWLPSALALVLALVALFAFGGSSTTSPTTGSGGKGSSASGQLSETGGTVVDRSAAIHPKGVYFGISTLSSPDPEETDEVAAASGQYPTVQEFFVKWNEDYDPKTIDRSYRIGALPLLTWEPWAGGDRKADQPAYALSGIASGSHDDYVRRFARAVKGQGKPLVLRFAHEMNASWYTWSEERNGNRQGDYIAAWRHVHDVFRDEGVDNVIWYWCPNSVEGTDGQPLSRFYPGEDYVDWIGMDAYSVEDEKADTVVESTYLELANLTDKPIFIGETGAKPGSNKAVWITDLFRWMSEHPDVIGFCWFQHDSEVSGRFDWRFTTSAGAQTAFHDGLASLDLVRWPLRLDGVTKPTP